MAGTVGTSSSSYRPIFIKFKWFISSGYDVVNAYWTKLMTNDMQTLLGGENYAPKVMSWDVRSDLIITLLTPEAREAEHMMICSTEVSSYDKPVDCVRTNMLKVIYDNYSDRYVRPVLFTSRNDPTNVFIFAPVEGGSKLISVLTTYRIEASTRYPHNGRVSIKQSSNYLYPDVIGSPTVSTMSVSLLRIGKSCPAGIGTIKAVTKYVNYGGGPVYMCVTSKYYDFTDSADFYQSDSDFMATLLQTDPTYDYRNKRNFMLNFIYDTWED